MHDSIILFDSLEIIGTPEPFEAESQRALDDASAMMNFTKPNKAMVFLKVVIMIV